MPQIFQHRWRGRRRRGDSPKRRGMPTERGLGPAGAGSEQPEKRSPTQAPVGCVLVVHCVARHASCSTCRVNQGTAARSARQCRLAEFPPQMVQAKRAVRRSGRCVRPRHPTRLRERPAQGATSRTSVLDEPQWVDGFGRRCWHHGRTESIVSWRMRQWANDEVGVDPADCAGAARTRPARRRTGGEHDARTHGGVPFRRWPNRNPWIRQLLRAFSPCAGRAQSQDRNCSVTSGEICTLLQAGKGSARTAESPP